MRLLGADLTPKCGVDHVRGWQPHCCWIDRKIDGAYAQSSRKDRGEQYQGGDWVRTGVSQTRHAAHAVCYQDGWAAEPIRDQADFRGDVEKRAAHRVAVGQYF